MKTFLQTNTTTPIEWTNSLKDKLPKPTQKKCNRLNNIISIKTKLNL